MSLQTIRNPHRALSGLVIFAVVGLLVATSATADPLQPISIGPVSVGDGAVTAGAASDGDSNTNVTVTVDGQPASVDATGQVSASVDLSGQSAVTVAITDPATGNTTTYTVPVGLIGPGGVIPASVFDLLRQAGVAVAVPPSGFTSTGGAPVQLSGTVADGSTLASLTVNGVDALSLVQPSGTFGTSVPGTDKQVTIEATDTRGVSESRSYQISPATTTTSRSSAGASSVAATSATGVTIAGVRYTTAGVKTRKQVRVVITVKDKRGLLIRGAKVRIRAALWQHDYVASTAARFTNGAGQATFTLRLRAARFTQRRRLFTVETALTPAAQTTRTTSVRVPRLAQTHRR